MPGFTPPSFNLDWSAVGFINEFIDAISERNSVLPHPGPYPPPLPAIEIGDDVQAASFWAGLQGKVEQLAVQYVDDTDSGADWDAQSSIPLHTLATFRASAGINPNGFRRAPGAWDGIGLPAFEFGLMEEGDIIDNWIFEDLQKAIDALKFTLVFQSTVGLRVENMEVRNATVEFIPPPCSQMIDDVDQAWGGSSFNQTSTGPRIYRVQVNLREIETSGDFSGRLERRRMQPVVDAVSPARPATGDLYWRLINPSGFTTFENLDNIDANEGELQLEKPLPSATASAPFFGRGEASDIGKLGDFTGNPRTLAAQADCDNLDAQFAAGGDSVQIVLKWEFEITL